MRLISLKAISRNHTPITMWLQEVDEQVQSDTEVKAGVFFVNEAKVQHLVSR